MPRITPKPVVPVTPELVFAHLASLPGAVWLDSTLRYADRGRYSILACAPVAEVVLYDREWLLISGGVESAKLRGERFYRHLTDFINDGLFAIGYVSYEGMYPFVQLPRPAAQTAWPDAHFCLYDQVAVFDHDNARFVEPVPREWLAEHPAIDTSGNSTIATPPPHRESFTKDAYIDAVRRVKDHIHEGDIYQANLTCRFEIPAPVAPWSVYNRLRQLNPSPYGAFLNFGDRQVLSSSPERMFYREQDRITTCPIKGTSARGRSPKEDQERAEALLHSEKDRAELLMIVDLLRNDLGRIARTGTVRVDSLFRTEIFSSLIHLVSDISATLRPGLSYDDIFAALFPGGSITGAPKRRAVEILAQIEPCPRDLYTGCIGYISRDKAEFNIAIRTIMHTEDAYTLHAGCGIVADSVPEREYEEMLLKARNLFGALGINV